MKRWLVRIVIAVAVVIVSVAALVAASFAMVWYAVGHQPIDAGLEQDLRRLVDQHPVLQKQFDGAAADGVLTMSEANALVSAAEKLHGK